MSGVFSHRIIRASAGTGKTFQLSNRFLGLLDSGAPSHQILATTFTRKAAGEILDRVLLRLAEAALDDRSCAELGQHIGQPALSRIRCLELLQQVARSLHRLRVSTLDSFFAQLARSFSLELNLPPGWQIVEPLEDARLRSEAIEAVLRQQPAVTLRTLVHLLTKGEASRGISELIRATVNELYELFQETGREAWEKIPHRKPLSAVELAQTVDDLRAAVLPNTRMQTARDGDLERALAGEWEEFIKKGLAAKVLDGTREFYRQEIPQDAVGLYEKLLQHTQAELVGRVALQTRGTYDLLEMFHVEYQRLKQERRALRFDDVTRRLSTNALGHVDRLAFRLDGRIDHLLLDEFQDTSPAQWQVVRPFAERVTGSGKQTSFFCVGDIKQAIYGWRGGVAEIFDAIALQLQGLSADSLNQSFRSSQAVIDTVNTVCRNLSRHSNLERTQPAVQRWCDRFEQHSTARDNLAGYACLVTAPRADEAQGQLEATLECAAQRVAQLVQQAPGQSVGVLVRRNHAVGQLIYQLRKLRVPASEEGGNPLTDSAAVMLVLSLLRLADHPGNTVARFHVASSPLGAALGFQDDRDELAAVRLSRQVRRALLEAGYGSTLYHWAKILAGNCNRRELSRLEQLVELGYGYQAQATLRTADFVAYVQNQRVSDPSAADVRVMTVHQAKGLEFDIVGATDLDSDIVGEAASFVVHRQDPTSPVDCVCRYAGSQVQQLLPAKIQQMFVQATERKVTESLCVLYVTITRAVHALHMVVAPAAANARSMPRTYAGLLRAALVEGDQAPPERTLYAHGDPAWFKHHRREPRVTSQFPDATRDIPEDPLTVRLAPPGKVRQRGLERASPSGLEGGSRVRLADRIGQDNSLALDRGSLIHAWFEQIRWLDDGPPDDVVLRQVANEVLHVASRAIDLEELLSQFHEMLKRPSIAGALSQNEYRKRCQGVPRLEVHNERPIAVRDDDRILTGYIDRLVLVYDGKRLVSADIIDFKTDRLTPDGVAQRVEFYRPQVEAYRRAVAIMTRLDPRQITARLLFVGEGNVQVM